MSELSPQMKTLIKEQREMVMNGQTKIFDPETIETTYDPTIVYPVPTEIATTISEHFLDGLTGSLKEKIVIQPFNGFHFTVNWYTASQIGKSDYQSTIESLTGKLNLSAIACSVFAPVVGHMGLYIALDQDGQAIIQQNRKVVFEEWSRFGIEPAFPPDGFLAYAYLARYIAPLSDEDKKFLANLKPARFEIKFDELLFLRGNKFLAPESRQILHRWPLNSSPM